MNRTETIFWGTVTSLTATCLWFIGGQITYRDLGIAVASLILSVFSTIIVVRRSRRIGFAFKTGERPNSSGGSWVGVAEIVLPKNAKGRRFPVSYDIRAGFFGYLHATSHYRGKQDGKIHPDELTGGFFHDDYLMLIFCKANGVKAFGALLLKFTGETSGMSGYVLGVGSELGSQPYIASIWLKRPAEQNAKGRWLFTEWEKQDAAATASSISKASEPVRTKIQ